MEDEGEEDEDISGSLGFSSGGDEYMIRKKRPMFVTTITSSSSAGGRTRECGSGSGAGGSTVRPSCQADICTAYPSEAKHYHRRHKICVLHDKASVFLFAGLQQRFSQQCSREETTTKKEVCNSDIGKQNTRRFGGRIKLLAIFDFSFEFPL